MLSSLIKTRKKPMAVDRIVKNAGKKICLAEIYEEGLLVFLVEAKVS